MAERYYKLTEDEVAAIMKKAANGQTKALKFWQRMMLTFGVFLLASIIGIAVKFIQNDMATGNNTEDISSIQQELRALPRIEEKLEWIVEDVRDLKRR